MLIDAIFSHIRSILFNYCSLQVYTDKQQSESPFEDFKLSDQFRLIFFISVYIYFEDFCSMPGVTDTSKELVIHLYRADQ